MKHLVLIPEVLKPCSSKTRRDIPFLMNFTSIRAESLFLQQIFYMNLFVAGLPYDLDDAELEEIFEKFGPVVSAKVAMDRETGKSRGFGFVNMQNEEDGKQAIELLNDIQLGRSRKPLVVKAAEDRPGGGSGGGGSRGGFGGGGGGYRGGGGGDRGGGGQRGGGGFQKRW